MSGIICLSTVFDFFGFVSIYPHQKNLVSPILDPGCLLHEIIRYQSRYQLHTFSRRFLRWDCSVFCCESELSTLPTSSVPYNSSIYVLIIVYINYYYYIINHLTLNSLLLLLLLLFDENLLLLFIYILLFYNLLNI